MMLWYTYKLWYTYPLKKTWLFMCFVMQLGKNVGKITRTISFKIIGHIASVHYVPTYLFRLLLYCCH